MSMSLRGKQATPNIPFAGFLGDTPPLVPARFPHSFNRGPYKQSNRWLLHPSWEVPARGIPDDRRWGSAPQWGSAKISGLGMSNGAVFPCRPDEIVRAMGTDNSSSRSAWFA